MATAIRHDHRPLRLVIVVVLSLVSISMWLPDFARGFGHPVGVPSNAEYAQIARLSGPFVPFLPGTPQAERMRLVRNGGCWQPSPGIPCNFAVLNNGRVLHFHWTTVAEPRLSGTIAAIRCAVALLWLIGAAFLVMLRPSHATWAFFVFSLYGQTPDNIFTEVGPPWWQVATSTFDMTWENALPFVALVFALYLMQPEILPGWRRFALIASYAAAIGVAIFEAAATLAVAAGSATALELVTGNSLAQHVIGDVSVFVPPLLLLATYLDSDRTSRERIRWVLAGFTLGAIALAVSPLALRISYFYYSVCLVIYVLAITGSTMYAVLRHRIIDVNVILSRTVVYTLLSGVVVGLFALVDLFFTKTLSESNTGLIADVILALVLGFFLNTMHRRLDRFVDGIVFRKRHIAENHVALVAESTRYAPSIDALDGMMIEEPVRAFGLTFGALARFVDDEALDVVFATVPQLEHQTLGTAGRLASYLRSQGRSVPLRDHYWHSDAFARAGVEAVIAVPVFSQDTLAAVAFYGRHRTATELDGDEIDLLERVAKGAGAAYDKLRTRALEEELVALKLQRTAAG